MKSTSRLITRVAFGASLLTAGAYILNNNRVRVVAAEAPAAKPVAAPARVGKKVYISGPPGAGKGTQSELILKHYNLVHISTGDLLRDEVKVGTVDGKTAKGFMDKGLLVPQSLIEPMVQRRLSQQDCVERGFLLDGYPREVCAARSHSRSFFLYTSLHDRVFMCLCFNNIVTSCRVFITCRFSTRCILIVTSTRSSVNQSLIRSINGSSHQRNVSCYLHAATKRSCHSCTVIFISTLVNQRHRSMGHGHITTIDWCSDPMILPKQPNNALNNSAN
jgi:hypothetical protein